MIKTRLAGFKNNTNYWIFYCLPAIFVGGILSFSRGKRQKPSQPKKILLFLLEHLGDGVVSTPLIRALRVTFPAADIQVVASPISHSLLRECPHINRIIKIHPQKGWARNFFSAFRIALQLSKIKADIVILPTESVNYAFNDLIAIMTSAQWRISLQPPPPLGPLSLIKRLKSKLFFDELLTAHGNRHEIHFRLDIAEALGAKGLVEENPEVFFSGSDLDAANRLPWNDAAPPPSRAKPQIAFGLGASKAKRQWPLQDFATTIKEIYKIQPFTPILIVGPGEQHLAETLASMLSIEVHYNPNASVGQSMAIMSKCVLFIGNDSGPMHLAAGLKIPVIEISCHPTSGDLRHFNSPVRLGPFGVPSKIFQPIAKNELCRRGCISETEPHCITNINPEEVAKAAIDMLLIIQKKYIVNSHAQT